MCLMQNQKMKNITFNNQQSTILPNAVTTLHRNTKVFESRKIRKPLMEKRRRARINDCLNELKQMLLDADADLKKNHNRPTKLEKADILELTVRHLRKLNNKNSVTDKEDNKFKAGFSECAREVKNELSRLTTADYALKQRLYSHLNVCLEKIDTSSENVMSSPIIPTTKNFKGYTLIPTKLPNGDIALVIPANLNNKCNDDKNSTKSLQINNIWRPW